MFKAGEVVELKSGGPFMTVDGTSESHRLKPGMLYCIWFEGNEMKSGCFKPETLKAGTPLGDME